MIETLRTPLFNAGQTVLVSFSRTSTTPAGRYKIIRPLPASDVIRYRVKGETEAFERVIEERVMRPQEAAPQETSVQESSPA